MYHFPYTNFHDLNLDWIIEYVKSAKSEIEDLIKQFENIIVQTTGESTDKVMSQNAVTVQLNYLSTRINTLNSTVEGLTTKLNKAIADLEEFETETESNFESDRSRLAAIETSVTRFYVIVTHTAEGNTLNVSYSDLLNYRIRANVRYYIKDDVKTFTRAAYEVGNPTAGVQIQTLPYEQENAVYRADISVASSAVYYSVVSIIPVSQTSGQSKTSVMSQQAVTNLFNSYNKLLKVKVTESDGHLLTANHTYDDMVREIEQGALIYLEFHPVSTDIIEYYILNYTIRDRIIFMESPSSTDPHHTNRIVITDDNVVDRTAIPNISSFVIETDGNTISGTQLSTLQNILTAIAINQFYPQIYLKFPDNERSQVYVYSAYSTTYVLRNDEFVITYTNTPSATIERVEKYFVSSATNITRIAKGGEEGYNILQIIGSDVDITNYYVVGANIDHLQGGDSKLISVSMVAGVPVILIYSNGIAFSGSWSIQCRHK